MRPLFTSRDLARIGNLPIQRTSAECTSLPGKSGEISPRKILKCDPCKAQKCIQYW